MEEIIEKDSENINSDEWKFLLLVMLMDDIKQRNTQWKSFENELIYKNRFSLKHPVIDEIHQCASSVEKTIKENTVFYRARVFEKSNFNKFQFHYVFTSFCNFGRTLRFYTVFGLLIFFAPP